MCGGRTACGPAFELSVVALGRQRAWLRAAGELDLAAAGALASLLARQAEAGRRFVRLDVSGVTFIDCSCLGVLVGAHHRLLARDGLLVLTGAGPRVERLVRLTRLDGTLCVEAAVSDPPAGGVGETASGSGRTSAVRVPRTMASARSRAG